MIKRRMTVCFIPELDQNYARSQLGGLLVKLSYLEALLEHIPAKKKKNIHYLVHQVTINYHLCCMVKKWM